MTQEIGYYKRFETAISACRCDSVDPDLNATNFDPTIFGVLGGHYKLGQPRLSRAVQKRSRWLPNEVDAWLAGYEVAGKGFEAGFLIDLAKYGEKHPATQLTQKLVCWRPGKDGRVACLHGDGNKRLFTVFPQEQSCYFYCWFLLRSVSASR